MSTPADRQTRVHLRRSRAAAAAVLGLGTVVSEICRADIDPLSGIDFVRITHPGNAPWAGNGQQGDLAIGRGRVDHEYGIGRLEVTTSQWTEFFNAVYDRPANDSIPFVNPPLRWGATATTPNTPGGQRWRVPAGNELRPVGGISWRTAAVYTNWLNNSKATNREAFLTGAYNVSTFGFGPGFRFTDQQAHTPGARYWIPTWDESIKASHFDPNRFGQGQPGYWIYNNSSNQFPRFGPPGSGDANYGWQATGGLSPYSVPLGAYPQSVTPWQLLDTAGATTEWTEGIRDVGELVRVHEGSFWDSTTGASVGDSIYSAGDELPHIDSLEYGLRIATSIPAPTGFAAIVMGMLFRGIRGRRGVDARGTSHESE